MARKFDSPLVKVLADKVDFGFVNNEKDASLFDTDNIVSLVLCIVGVDSSLDGFDGETLRTGLNEEERRI